MRIVRDAMRRTLPAVSLFCLAASLGLALSIAPVFGTAARALHVTWADISDNERAALERRFGLDEARPLGVATFSYVPRPNPEALSALVAHPAVRLVDGLDRARM